MKIHLKLAFVACFAVSTPYLTANAQKPASNSSHHISDSRILPYIINNPDVTNSVIRVRCFTNSRERQSKRGLIRDSLLQTPKQEIAYPRYITIEVEGSCHNVKIRLPNTPSTDYIPLEEQVYGDYWLYREGSGWNWLKRQ